MVIAFLSCNMIKSLIKFMNSLGPKEAGNLIVSAGGFMQAACDIEFNLKVKDRPKTIQPELSNAHTL